ncbi:riboflavin deaminase [Labrenzia sp. CP4]|jgi:5-amino-6-(5-phosphoribosylamino)uracil reductase|uniref:RibD family protein n=1 Tax=Labrenzia sp. CP4 TaxID=1674922 RepID=UPI0007864BB7|nr:dihydrofolate reductase family protein [Labrenzia sp. CP4]AMN56291.1 riboflavin deaminase [Labrenzia sp. CP4]
MQRPFIICHMITSLDGRLLPGRWPVSEEEVMTAYESAAERLDSDGWIVGRRTMEDFIASAEPCISTGPVPRPDLIAGSSGNKVAICFDRSGRLRPETGDLDGDHLVIVLSERVADDHVQDLNARGISVFFAGAEGTDLSGALTRISEAFDCRRLLLEGGGTLNGAFLAADMIDETSTLVFPVIDGQSGIPAIYEHTQPCDARRLELISSSTFDDGTIWIRHKVIRETSHRDRNDSDI